MYAGAEKRFGKQALFNFLKSFYHHYTGTRDANTDSFLAMCSEMLGLEARDYFQYWLALKNWKELDLKNEILG
jgi:hypothetical protein